MSKDATRINAGIEHNKEEHGIMNNKASNVEYQETPQFGHTLSDLNNHLFEQLERLNDDNLDNEAIEKELRRADGMTKIAQQIIQNGELAYKTMVHMDEYGYNDDKKIVPAMLEVKQ